MSFWVYSYCGNMTSYRFFKMSAADVQYYFKFRISWCPCLQKVKIYQQTKFRWHQWSTYINLWLGYYERLLVWKNKCPPYWNSTSGSNLDHFPVICILFCIRLPNLVQIYPFLKMAATAKYYFRFRICWCHCLQKVNIYQQTKFHRDISIDGWDITISDFEIQTSAMSEFYFRFRSRPFHRNRRVILHQNAEFSPNRGNGRDRNLK